LENRKDIRISTLIDYLDSFDMELEITAHPRNSTEKELLLRVKKETEPIWSNI